MVSGAIIVDYEEETRQLERVRGAANQPSQNPHTHHTSRVMVAVRKTREPTKPEPARSSVPTTKSHIHCYITNV